MASTNEIVFDMPTWTSVPPTPLPEAPSPVASPEPYVFVNVHALHCCGIKELKGIVTVQPKQAIQDFCFQRTAPECVTPASYSALVRERMAADHVNRYKFGCAFVLFTQAFITDPPRTTDQRGYGDTLSTFIQQQGLGAVTIAGKERNPNSGNIVTVFLWKVDHTALGTWWKANPVSVPHKERLLLNWNTWKNAHQL